MKCSMYEIQDSNRSSAKRRTNRSVKGEITCATQSKVRRVRSVIVQACLDAGAKNDEEVRHLIADALAGVVKYQVAAVKAHQTMGTY